MTDEEADISDTLKARSDQLNADELMAGPITVCIKDVKRFADEKQPLGLSIGLFQADGKDKPFKPCKTVRRLLVAMWDKDPRKWIGRTFRLVRDPTVVYSGKTLGGIRVDAASHITKTFEMVLTEVRGKPKTFTIRPLSQATDKQEQTQQNGAATQELTLPQKYAKRLAELKPYEIEAAYVKFDREAAPKMDDATAQQIYKLFSDIAEKNQGGV